MRRLQVLSLIAALLAAIIATPVPAQDTVVLSDGTEVTGEIIRELDGNVWLLETIGTVEIERFYAKSRVAEIRRDTATITDEDVRDTTREMDRRQSETADRPGVPKGAVISLEGTVGMQMTAKTLIEILPILEDELGTDGTGIVVFKVNSGGGALLEIQKISDVIQNEYKPRFEVAAWIESAISAAAMSVHCVENIFFMPRGNYGACTGWSGQLEAVAGRTLEQVLYDMELISARGGYDKRIMRSMQIDDPLRATIDERTGEVEWFQSSDGGERLVNPAGEILTFNAQNAYEFRFSKGTASNLDELTTMLGYGEINWIGRDDPERIYPISRAEAQMIRYRAEISEDERRFGEYQTNYNIAVGAAQGANREIRGALVARARRHLASIKQTVDKNPFIALRSLGVLPEDFALWVEDQEEMLRELMRRP